MKPYSSIGGSDFKNFFDDFRIFLKRLIRFGLESIKRFFWVILLVVLIAGCWGYYIKTTQQGLYEATMTCAYNNLHKKLFGEMISRLDNLAVNNSYNHLAQEISLPVEEVRKIKRLIGKNISGSPLEEDITEAKLPMYFTAVVTDPGIFPKLQEAMINYMNEKIPFQQNRLDAEAGRRNLKISSLDSSISQINRTLAGFLYSDQGENYSNLKEISKLIELKESLVDRKIEESKLSSMDKSVELLYGFASTEKPNHDTPAPLYKFILAGLALGIALAVILNFFKLAFLS